MSSSSLSPLKPDCCVLSYESQKPKKETASKKKVVVKKKAFKYSFKLLLELEKKKKHATVSTQLREHDMRTFFNLIQHSISLLNILVVRIHRN